MPCFWYKPAKDGESYDYLTHHVDDFLLTSNNSEKFLEELRKDYVVTGEEFPSIHLGMNIQQNENGTITLSCHDYICEVIDRVKKLVDIQSLKTFDSTTKDNWEPELDETPLLEPDGIKLYQCLIGIGIWLICIGRFDIHYAVNQLSCFTQAPRKGHVLDALRIFGFLEKWQNKGIATSGNPTLKFWDQIDSRKMTFPGNMKDY